MSEAGHPTPLTAALGEHGARWSERDNRQVAEDYGDVVAEYGAIRDGLAVIDRSERSRLLVTGTDAGLVLARALGTRAGELEEGRAAQTAMLDGAGHIADLVLAARTGGIAYLLSGEPGRGAALAEGLRSAAQADYDVQVEERTERTCSLLVTGPEALRFVAEELSDRLPPLLAPMHAALFEFERHRTMVVRASDTGEEGVLFVVSAEAGAALVERVVAAGGWPAGRAAHEIARIEAGIPAWPDLEGGLTPGEADLATLLGYPEGERWRSLAAVLIEGTVPIDSGATVRSGDEEVGEVRSSAWSPGFGEVVALALLRPPHDSPGTALTVGGRSGTVVMKPMMRRRQRQDAHSEPL